VITSTAAAGGAAGKFGVGYVDSVDGVIAGQPANTVELRFTVMGDANLDRVVDMNDAVRLQANYNATGSPAWDRGNFNYDSTVDATDALMMTRNYGVTATGSTAPATLSGSTTLAATNSASSVRTSGSTNPASVTGGDQQDLTTSKNRRGRKRK
jgi:hypothetical protein